MLYIEVGPWLRSPLITGHRSCLSPASQLSKLNLFLPNAGNLMKQGVAGQQGIPTGKRSATFHMAIVIFTSFQIRLTEKEPYLA